MTGLHSGDFTDNDWLLLVEDDGPTGMGRVIGFFVFKTEADANAVSLGAACDHLGLFHNEPIPDDITIETMTYGDFKASYGNRMPLVKRGVEL